MRVKVAWALIFALGFVVRVNADPIFSARIICIGNIGCSPGLAPPPVIDSPFPAFVEAHPVLPLFKADGTTWLIVADDATAAASFGTVGGLSRANLNILEFFPITWGGVAQESSSFVLDNLLLSGPVLGEIIPVSFNVSIDGSFSATSSGGPFASGLSANVSGGGSSSSLGGGGFALGSLGADSAGRIDRSGIFSAFPASGDGLGFATSPVFNARVGDMLTVSLQLETSAIAVVNFGGGPGFADAFVDFSNTFGFPTIGPVFNLPDGYTVNSLDGFIVNNRFGTPGVEPIPEPGTLLLLGSGLLGVARYGRKKLRRKPSA